MKLKYEFAIEEVAGEKIAVAVGTNLGKRNIIRLNSTAAHIMNVLKNDVTVEEIISSVKDHFEIDDTAEMEKSVNSFIEKLRKEDLVE